MSHLTQYRLKSQKEATLEAIRQLKKLQASNEKDFLIEELKNFLELVGNSIPLEGLNIEYREMLKRIDIFFLENFGNIKEEEYGLKLTSILPVLAWNIASIMVHSQGRKRFNLDTEWFGECLSEFTFDFIRRVRNRYSRKAQPTKSIIDLITMSSGNIMYMYHLKITGTKVKHFSTFFWFEKIRKDGKSKGLTDQKIAQIAETQDPKKFKQYLDLSKAYSHTGGFENRLPISLNSLPSKYEENLSVFQVADPDNASMVISILQYQVFLKDKLVKLFTEEQLDIIELFLGMQVRDDLSIIRFQSLLCNQITGVLNLTINQIEHQMVVIADKIFYLYCLNKGIPVEEFIGARKGNIAWTQVSRARLRYQKENPNCVFTLGKDIALKKK